MAWRHPRFSYAHALRAAADVDPARVTLQNPATAKPAVRLYDDRAAVSFAFDAAAADHHVQVHRAGTAGSRPLLERLYVPWQAWGGADVRLRAADDAAFTLGVTELVAATATSDGEPVDFAFAANDQDFLRVAWPGGNDVWEMTELLLTNVFAPLEGPNPLPNGWPDAVAYNTLAFPKESGERPTLTLGAPQRSLELRYPQLSEATTAAMDAFLAAVGTAHPFVFDPAFDDEPAVVMKLGADPAVRLENPVPQSGAGKTKTYALELLEVLE